MGQLISVFVDYASKWPWSDADNAFIVFILTMICSVMTLLATLLASPWRLDETEVDPPQIPPALAAWNISRNSHWLRLYMGIWRSYPRDICEYVPKCIFILLWSPLAIATAVLWCSLCLYAVIGLARYTILAISWIPTLITYLPSAIGDFIPLLLPRLQETGVIWVIGGVAAIVFLRFFLRSSPVRLTYIWLKAKKERYCLRIRIE